MKHCDCHMIHIHDLCILILYNQIIITLHDLDRLKIMEEVEFTLQKHMCLE